MPFCRTSTEWWSGGRILFVANMVKIICGGVSMSEKLYDPSIPLAFSKSVRDSIDMGWTLKSLLSQMGLKGWGVIWAHIYFFQPSSWHCLRMMSMEEALWTDASICLVAKLTPHSLLQLSFLSIHLLLSHLSINQQKKKIGMWKLDIWIWVNVLNISYNKVILMSNNFCVFSNKFSCFTKLAMLIQIAWINFDWNRFNSIIVIL